MAKRLPFNQRDRHRSTQSHLGYRPVNNWGDGDLPAPWAEGDIVNVLADAYCLQGNVRDGINRWWYPGFAVIAYVCSIDEGDAWYVRLCNGKPGPNGPEWESSDRLHIAHGSRTVSLQADVDLMAGVELVDTADPEGLALRNQMIAEGWSPDA